MKQLHFLLLLLIGAATKMNAQTVYTLNWASSFASAWTSGTVSGNCTNIGGSGVNNTVSMVSTGGASTFVAPYPKVNGSGDFVVAGSASAVEIDMNFSTNTQVLTKTFTFSQPVSGVKFSIADIDKSNASSNAYYDSVAIVGNDRSHTILPLLTKFNSTSNWIIINGNSAYANTTNGQGGNASSTSTDAADQQCTVIIDFGTAVITSFTVVYGNVKTAQSNPSLQAIALGNISFKKTITVAGTVWNDKNGSAAGTFTGIQNSSEAGINASGMVYASLINTATAKVIATNTVNANGVYTFAGVPQNLNVNIVLSQTAGVFGSAAPVTDVPAGWANTSPLLQSFTTNSTATNIAGKDFGMERLPDSDNQTYTLGKPLLNTFITLNGAGTILTAAALKGNDAEDGVLGAGKKVVITQVPANSQLYYNNVLVVNNTIIASYNPDLLKIKFTSLSATTSQFTFAFIDAAGKQDPTPATYTVNWMSVLPVQKIEAGALLNGTAVTVNWVTVNEINTSRFFVERSTGNDNFVTVAERVAAGNNAGTLQYDLQDDIAQLTGTAVIYYRIKLVSMDGQITYSNTAAIKLTNINSVKTWPNPVTSMVNISLFSGVKTSLQVRIADAGGRVLRTAGYNIVKGNNQVVINNLTALSKGVYILQLTDMNGNVQLAQKIIKD